MTRSIYDDETLEALRDQVRRFVEAEVVPHVEAWEAAGAVPREVLRKMGELGFLGIRYPERFGGSNLSTLATVAFVEELSRSTCAGFNVTVLVHTDMASPHLANFGSPEQLERWLPDVIAGKTITAVAVTEPGGGSDVAALRTKAEKRGNGWRLNGSKTFITNGALGDLYFVAARTDPDEKPSRGISMFIVEKGTPGFTVARKLDKMGWRASDTAELSFQDVDLPADALLGEAGRGFYAIMKNFQNERIVLGAMAVGESQKALDITLDYVRQRQAFGGPLWDKQAVRQKLAGLQAEVAAARQLVWHAAWLDSQGQDAVKEVSMVKALCGELVNRVMYACQQFHGGYGYMREYPIERMVRDARIQSIGGGATEVMLEEVAKRM
ncbi:acyl-CoA dehydrogenase [Tistlia consotensis]|uniref:Acyl-CoA dehydrogenase n=1 Tax=Tistlia consotensis USBA 355 TaxID=560819 RepID=A0A1Y6CRI9_9PROT|nr:acyl-CoA dehydrogenase family protein [Tistlia consotensis]SMF72345.1 acyl-CoA dehydrogenase [Tistlia consotensis USBA 355]SNS08929.1 acyl-CoA dehydrogenase [Tistlia consotensis]